ncbi:MAG: transcription antitermination factor NusB [Myxococcales bacterium]|nr:transcription antitermination factor NusB [Myxococcales bacterium]
MGIRRRSRECALQILYGIDWSGHDPMAACEHFWSRFAGERPAAYEQIRNGCDALVVGVVRNVGEIDTRLQEASQNWKLDRMSVVDRNILRLGAYELLFASRNVPRKVVLNEAIEIAKKFGSKESGGFVNGVLHQVSLRAASAASVPSPADPDANDVASSLSGGGDA